MPAGGLIGLEAPKRGGLGSDGEGGLRRSAGVPPAGEAESGRSIPDPPAPIPCSPGEANRESSPQKNRMTAHGAMATARYSAVSAATM